MPKPTLKTLRPGARISLQVLYDDIAFTRNRSARYTPEWKLLDRLEVELEDFRRLWFPRLGDFKRGAQ